MTKMAVIYGPVCCRISSSWGAVSAILVFSGAERALTPGTWRSGLARHVSQRECRPDERGEPGDETFCRRAGIQ
jgi:hypothetical protein